MPNVTKRVSPSNALGVTNAYACVRLLSESIATLPLKPYRKLPDGTRVEAGSNARIAQLLRRPEPGSTSVDLIARVVADLNLRGNSYIGKIRENGLIVALQCLDPARVVPERRGIDIVYRYQPLTGRELVLTTADIVHVKNFSVDGVAGVSPVQACRMGLGIDASTSWHARQFFQNGARPGGVLSLGPEPDRDTVVKIQEGFQQKSGVDQHHRVLVLAGEAKYHNLSFSPADVQFLESREFQAAETARIFGVPPWMIGAKSGDSLTYSTVSEQNRAFATHSLRPWCVRIEQAISSDPELCPGAPMWSS